MFHFQNYLIFKHGMAILLMKSPQFNLLFTQVIINQGTAIPVLKTAGVCRRVKWLSLALPVSKLSSFIIKIIIMDGTMGIFRMSHCLVLGLMIKSFM